MLSVVNRGASAGDAHKGNAIPTRSPHTPCNVSCVKCLVSQRLESIFLDTLVVVHAVLESHKGKAVTKHQTRPRHMHATSRCQTCQGLKQQQGNAQIMSLETPLTAQKLTQLAELSCETLLPCVKITEVVILLGDTVLLLDETVLLLGDLVLLHSYPGLIRNGLVLQQGDLPLEKPNLCLEDHKMVLPCCQLLYQGSHCCRLLGGLSGRLAGWLSRLI